jgi:hypothetical protein
MSNKDEIRIRFESLAVFSYVGCDVAYGRLYLNDMYTPALRICMDTHIADLPLKINRNWLIVVEKAPYYVQIPPYQYVAYTTPFDVLYLISKRGAERVFCNAGAENCNKLPPVVRGNTIEDVYEDVYSAIKDAWVSNEVL